MEHPRMIGVSQDLERIRKRIRELADARSSVVITGETGVGKELVARSLYAHSPRADKPFVKVSCYAFAEVLLESELFGKADGASIGKRQKGPFELSAHGVLFLDEVGDIPPFLQARLLKIIEEGEFDLPGSVGSRKIPAWIIAATNRNPEKDANFTPFFEKLHDFPRVATIHIPPLRRRPEDIGSLIAYFLEEFQSRLNAPSMPPPESACMERLLSYPWPGNVRELQNVIRRVLVIRDWDQVLDELSWKEAGGDGFSFDALPFFDFKHLLESGEPISLKKIKQQVIERVELEVIRWVLTNTCWDRECTAKILKMSRKKLLRKIEELKLADPTCGRKV
jgi:two-component system, NtrC family, response regulator AtoC